MKPVWEGGGARGLWTVVPAKVREQEVAGPGLSCDTGGDGAGEGRQC